MLPNFSAFDIKAQVVWGEPVPAADVALTARLRRRLRGAGADRRRHDLQQARSQMTPHEVSPSVALIAIVLLLGAVIGLQAARERLEPRSLPRGETGNLLYVQSPEVADTRSAVISFARC